MATKPVNKVAALCLVLCAVGLKLFCDHVDLPLTRVVRNALSPSTPAAVAPKYQCAPGALAEQLTVVVTVKDACSQMPGFVKALERTVGTDTALIVTWPKFEACDPKNLGVDFAPWKTWKSVPVAPSSSPMVGWLDAVPSIRTEYALLLHNDGYALDDFFACELVQALETRKPSAFVVAAPMLYESKADGSLAAHATQSRLRFQGGVVRHDHSVARALNRGGDYPEADQADFLEDHGFVVRTDAIAAIVDPKASYTLEYVDMILSLKAHHWKAVFVPTARLEFRIAEFSWRDVPYFMYKRSEATCHGTRDYLAAKWRAAFPNTGFWTYIKYTIVESHAYPAAQISALPWRQQAQLFLGFFQMAGFNRYDGAEYVALLTELDGGAFEKKHRDGFAATASRETRRRAWAPADVKPRPGDVGAADLLPVVADPWLPSIEADMPLEYLPFGVAKLQFPNASCAAVLGDGDGQFWPGFCGVAVQASAGCHCWINLPTFKTHSLLGMLVARAAALLKVPSRVTTYLEMALGSSTPAGKHVAPVAAGWKDRAARLLKAQISAVADAGAWADVTPRASIAELKRLLAASALSVYTCGGAATADGATVEPCDAVDVAFAPGDVVVSFSGRPPSPYELKLALTHLA